MTSIELKRLARRIARLEQGQANMSKPQLAYSSIENGNIKSYEGDSLKMSIGLQDDGSSTMRFFDGPVPPVPAGFTALADGPLIQGTWDGSFVDGLQATYDLAYLEVAATLVDDDSRVSFATITAKEGASATLVANQSGQWAVAVRSVSQAGKKSEFASAGTVEVKLVDLAGAIEAVQDSANGKNKVNYSDRPPTPADPGIFDDTWFVGSTGDLAPSIAAAPGLWTLQSGAFVFDWSAAADGKGVRFPDNTAAAMYGPYLPTKAGWQWTLSLFAARYSGSTATLNVRCYFYNAQKAYITSLLAATAGTGSGEVSGTVITPEGAVYARFGVVTTTANNSGFVSTRDFKGSAGDIGASDNWNIIEQYRHDGTGWVKVELSHYVFSTVDLGKATVGELDGIRIMARTMSSDVFTGTAFEGYIFKGTTFQTTNGSEFSDRGLFMYDLDGNPRIQAPVDGSDFTINAEIIARSLTSTGRASFLAEDNRIEPGAGLVLAAGVGDPPSPPVVSAYYPQVKAPLQEGDRGAYGLAWADGHFWRWVENLNPSGNRGRLEKISTDGEIVASFNTGDFLARNGAVGIGTELFLLGPKTGMNDRRWVQVFGLDGTYKRQWEYTNYGTGTYQPGIGCTESGNVAIAQCWADGRLSWRTYTTTGSLLSTVTRDGAVAVDCAGILVGTADFGAQRGLLLKSSTSNATPQFAAYGTSGNAYYPDQSWFAPGEVGMAWDGNTFFSMSPDGVIREYSTLTTGDDTNNWWATYRWAKDVDSDFTIDLSSRISPPARFSWPRRARLKVTAPNLPQGAGEIAPSLAHKTTTPVRTDFHSPSWWSVTGEPSAYYYELPGDWATASTPADGNNFPDGVPSVLSAASGLFEVKGDGSGHWGPLTFNADGTMSSSQVPEWMPVTTFASGYGPNSEWGFVPAYRIWPDGKVEWRGTIAGDFSATADPLTVPAAARPAAGVNVPIASNNSGSRLRRAEFSSIAAPTMLRVYSGDGTGGTWASLDSIFYYLT